MIPRFRLSPLTIAIIYVIIGVIWIILSDVAITRLAFDLESARYIQTIKGTGFVAVTGLVIWYLVWQFAKDHRTYEQKLEKALQEKEVLVSEVHHRVRNNLAVMMGILEMQGYQAEDERLQVIIKESIMRIQSIAFVHEYLYDTKTFSLIVNVEFINKLIENLLETYDTGDTLVTIDKKIEKLSIGINQAVPMAMLLNELITNAYHHAFEKQDHGTIHIRMYQRDQDINLVVEDNGKGLPEHFDLKANKSIGSVLISILTEQLKGDIHYSSEAGKGTQFHLKFPKKILKGSSSTLVAQGEAAL